MTCLNKELLKKSSESELRPLINRESLSGSSRSSLSTSQSTTPSSSPSTIINNSNSIANSINLTYSPSSNGSNLYCRICLMPVEPCHIKNYCLCSGSTGVYHKSCQLKWLIISNKDKCEVCNYTFNFKKEYGINYKFVFYVIFTFTIIGVFIFYVIFTFKQQIMLIMGLFTSLLIITCFNIFRTSEFYKLKKIDLIEIENESDLI